MKGSGILGLFFVLVTSALGCSTTSLSGQGMLPEGIESAVIPDVEAGGYLFFNSNSPVTLSKDFFSPAAALNSQESRDIALDQASIVLGTSSGELGGMLTFQSNDDAAAAWELFESQVDLERRWGKSSPPTLFLASGDRDWSNSLKEAYDSSKLVTIKEHDALAWTLLTNLPKSPPSRPVAAGILKLDQDLIGSVSDSANVEVDGIGNAFGLVRVDTLGFAIYTDNPLTISPNIDHSYLDASNASILFVSQSSYPGALVAFMLSVMAERTEMELVPLGTTNARYKSIEGLHLIIKNKDNLLYGAVATTRADSERLMLSALGN